MMLHPAGDLDSDALRLDFDRRLKLELQGSRVTSDDALGFMDIARQQLVDGRTGRKPIPWRDGFMSRDNYRPSIQITAFGRFSFLAEPHLNALTITARFREPFCVDQWTRSTRLLTWSRCPRSMRS